MKRYLFPFLLIVALGMSMPLFAQRLKSGAAYSREASALVSRYKKELTQMRRNLITENTDSSEWMSPYFYKLFGPGVFYRSALDGKFKLDYTLPGLDSSVQTTDMIAEHQRLNASIDDVLMNAYAQSPRLFHYSDAQIASVTTVSPVNVAGTKAEDLTSIYNKVEEIKDVADVVDSVDVDIQIVKPNFWKTSGKFSLQFTQNYFSENWYKGGNNNVTLLSNLVLEANYNDQNRVTWDNKLDLRLGFVTATSDSIHRYLTNNDKIYLYSKLGIKAAKNWYYTVSTEVNSQFLPGHKANDRRTYSKFLAPLDVYVSLGMDFKPSLKNGNTFSLALLPLTYKMRMLRDKDENIHRVYNMVDEDITHDFGSKLDLNCKLKIAKDFFWKSRLYFFTAYDYTEAEWENSFTYAFSKYINAEVYTLWRFDDNRDRKYYDDTLGYFQFKEYFTLGLTYSF